MVERANSDSFRLFACVPKVIVGKILLPFQHSWPEIGLTQFVLFSYFGKPAS
jgi:hypothetical protein